MRRLTVGVLLVCLMTPVIARAQQPLASEQADALLRRIEALEAQLTALRREVTALSADQPPAPGEPGSPVVNVDDPEDAIFQHAVGGDPPDEPDAEAPNADLPPALPVDAYGSLRVVAAWDSEGRSEIRNAGTRIGIRGEKVLTGEVSAFARLELGVNMVANDRAIIQAGDPGTPIGQGSQALSSRLGYVGLRTPVGAFSWGKQWAAYYDVAVFTDVFQVFSGAAGGAWAAGTDGGVSGTGRAERALQYREVFGPASVALQVQNRASSANDRDWADTWSLSGVLSSQNGFGIGAAYNEVRDGVESPTPNDPRLGDKAAVFGARYQNSKWYVAGLVAITEEHEIDNLGRPFDGTGFEFALRRDLTDRLWFEGGYNNLEPDSDQAGDFRVRFGVANLVYRYGPASRLFFGVKIEDSRRVDGSRLADHAFAGGLFFTF